MEKIKEKLENAWYRIKLSARQTVEWMSQNKELAIVLIPVGFYGIKLIGKGINNLSAHARMNHEQYLKERYMYDRSVGRYLKLNRKVSNSEQLEISQRKAAGENLAFILSSMGLLD